MPYDAVTPSTRSYWPSALLFATALGLVLLGGCFLIGVMLLSVPSAFGVHVAPEEWAGLMVLLVVLYGAAFGCLGGAVGLVGMGVRRLA